MSNQEANLKIRAANVGDAEVLHSLIAELAESTGLSKKFHGTVEAYIEHGFGERPRFEALLASLDGATVGAALYFYTFSSWRGEPGVYLQDIVVTEVARGYGAGRALLARLAGEASANGATHLRLAVDRGNLDAIRFYEQFGLKQADDDLVYEIDGPEFKALADAV